MKLLNSFTFLALISTFLVPLTSWSSSGITYHGRIVKPNGNPLESVNARFRIQIKAPNAGNCLLWEEEQSQNMLGSGGVFTITIGDSTNTAINYLRVDTYGWPMERVFSNRTAFTSLVGCALGGPTYTPDPADGRILQVSFKENGTDPTWEAFPATKINMVPMALNSLQLEGHRADEFLKIDPYVGQAPLSNANVNTLLGLIAGTSAAYVKPTDALGGDLAGTLGSGTVVGIRGRAVTSAVPTAGQVLKFDGTSWAPANDDSGGSVGDASYAAKGLVQFQADAATSGISVTAGVARLADTITAAGPVGGASTVPVITYDSKGRLTTVSTAAVDDTSKLSLAGGTMTGPVNMGLFNITNANSVAANNFSGRNLLLTDSDTNTATLRAPVNIATDYSLTLPTAAPVNGYVLSTDGTGQLTWMPAATGSVTSVTASAPVLSSGGTTPVISLDTGLGANKIPQVGGTALGANGVVVSNGTGTALTSLNCTVDQVIKFDASGFAVCGADTASDPNAFLNGGNSFTANATIGTNDAYALNFETQGTTKMTVLANGNVGIGTTNPSQALTVAGTLMGLGTGFVRMNTNEVLVGNSNSIGAGGGISMGIGNYSSFTSIAIGRSNGTSAGSGSAAMGISNNANWDNSVALGIGNTTGAMGAIAIGRSISNSIGGSLQIGASDSSKMTILSSGNVGIGTTSPGTKLDILDGAIRVDTSSVFNSTPATLTGKINSSTVDAPPILTITNYDSAVNTIAGIDFRHRNSVGAATDSAAIQSSLSTLTDAAEGGFMRFITMNAGTMTEQMRITSNGNVGIGTTSPATKLDVSGAVRIGNDASACAAGLAGSLRYNAGVVEYCNGSAWQAFGISGGGLTSLNGQSGSTQTFASGAAGTAPAFSSAANVHTLNIPLASGVGVTSGTLSKSDFDAFTAKLTSPLTTKGDLLSRDGSDHVRLPAGSNGQVLKANSATASGLEWTGISAASDLTGVLPIANGGTNSSAALTNGKVMVSSAGAIIEGMASNTAKSNNTFVMRDGSGNIAGALGTFDQLSVLSGGTLDLNGLTSGTISLVAPAAPTSYTMTLPLTAGTSGQVLSTNGSGVTSWIDSLTSTTGFQQNGNSFGAAATLGTNDTYALNFETQGTTKMTVLANGNVGIGTTNPTAPIEITKTSTENVSAVNGAKISLMHTISGNTVNIVKGLDVLASYDDPDNLYTGNSYTGIYGKASATAFSSGITELVGIVGHAETNASTVATSAYGLKGQITGNSNSNNRIINGYGAHVSLNASGANTITNGYGVYTGTIGGSTNKWSFYASDATAPSYFAGNVGIGTTTPGVYPSGPVAATSRVLEVAGDGSGSANSYGVLLTVNNRTTAASGDPLGVIGFASKTNPGALPAFIAGGLSGSGGANGFGSVLSFSTKPDNVIGASERLRIDSLGNVGIGTSAPFSTLHVEKNQDAPTSSIVFNSNSGASASAGVLLANGTDTYGSYLFGTGAGRFASIITDAPGGLYFDAQNAAGGMFLRTGATPTARLTILPAGNVGIGTVTPAAMLDVTDTSTTTSALIVPRAGNFTGTAANGMIRYNSTSTLFEFRQNGAWVNYTTVSDGRLKTNVTPVRDGLDLINQLNPVFYDWDHSHPKASSFSNKHEVGFIAQEVEKILPEVVNEGEDSFRSIEYGKMVSVVVAAVKELYAKVLGQDNRLQIQARQIASKADKSEIDQLKQENDKLKKENALIKARLEKIEKALQAK